MRYESGDDVKLRLQRSVVCLKGQPVHVDEVADAKHVMVTKILSGEQEMVLVAELDLDPSHLPLGYVMADGKVYMTSRKPCRKYKQGLTSENFHVKEVLSKEVVKARPRPELAPHSKAVARTMTGQFPDVGTAFQRVRAGQSKVMPFSREWAVGDEGGELCIIYRGEVVGYVTANSVKLLPEKFYLKESLELCLEKA